MSFIKKLIIGSLFVISISFLLIFWWSDERLPSSFLNEEELADILSREYKKMDEKSEKFEILDIIYLDESHVYIPFKDDDGSHSQSFWEWQNSEWVPIVTERRSLPKIWQLDKKDPSSLYFVWNFNTGPAEKIIFHMILERSYSASGLEDYQYQPRIQANYKEAINSSYGVSQIPKEWKSVILELNKYEQQEGIFSFWSNSNGLSYSYLLVNNNEEIVYPPIEEINGSAFYNRGGEQVSHLSMTMNSLEYFHWMDTE
ncbi:hypothetical protein [Alkalihalobacillus sp. 1P02AB]|uniref:hypothetical protein n=1 Tax=Alkalihalobacillus sp. 1P02AB TaxID=3132260 RepID=UPI0039A485EF